MMQTQVDWHQYNALMTAGNFAAANALVTQQHQAAPPAAAPAQAPQPEKKEDWPQSVEQRLGALEQLVKQVAAPAMDAAAQTGVAIMSALGNAMTPDQAAWVQARLSTSPGFFASQDCKDSIDIFIAEWQKWEGSKKA